MFAPIAAVAALLMPISCAIAIVIVRRSGNDTSAADAARAIARVLRPGRRGNRQGRRSNHKLKPRYPLDA